MKTIPVERPRLQEYQNFVVGRCILCWWICSNLIKFTGLKLAIRFDSVKRKAIVKGSRRHRCKTSVGKKCQENLVLILGMFRKFFFIHIKCLEYMLTYSTNQNYTTIQHQKNDNMRSKITWLPHALTCNKKLLTVLGQCTKMKQKNADKIPVN